MWMAVTVWKSGLATALDARDESPLSVADKLALALQTSLQRERGGSTSSFQFRVVTKSVPG